MKRATDSAKGLPLITRRRFPRALVIPLLTFLLIVPTPARPLGPLGGPFRVATTPPDWIPSESVAMDGAGGFVVVWDNRGGNYQGETFARRYGSGAVPLGEQFRVNPAIQGGGPDVAMAKDGRFVVVWTNYGQDGDGAGVYGRGFDGMGSPQGEEFLINTTTVGDQWLPEVAMDSAGNFVVVWQSEDSIRGRRYDAAGNPQGGEFHIVDLQPNTLSLPQLAISAAGSFAVAWEDAGGVRLQRYSAAGDPQGPAQTVIPQRDDLWEFDIGMDMEVRIVVALAAGGGVWVQRLDASGVPLGEPVRLTKDVEDFVEIAVRPDGSFVVLWTETSARQISARAFDPSGSPIGATLDVAAGWRGFFSGFPEPGLSAGFAGDFVAVWPGSVFTKDSVDLGVFARWFDHRACQIILKAKPKKVRVGQKVRFIAKLSPCARQVGDPVHLRRGSKKVAAKKSGEGPKVVFRLRLRKTATFRARMPAIPDRDLLGGMSNKVKVRVVRA